MIVGATPQRPTVFALAFFDGEVVDARNAHAHQAFLVEFPVLVAVTAVPEAAVVVPFVREAHGDPVLAESPHFFDQAIVELAIPLARQKRFDRFATLKKIGAIAPATVDRVPERDARRISRIP